MTTSIITFTADGNGTNSDGTIILPIGQNGESDVPLSVLYDSGGNMGGGTLKAEVSSNASFTEKAEIEGTSSAVNNVAFNINAIDGNKIHFEMSGSTNPNQKIVIVGNYSLL